ncbi:MAG: type II toxin-antitoxin system CcdA family antitoxin [Betaproteobacteria bacterium]
MGGRDPASGKRPANLTVNAELLDKARRLGINLSQTLEERLVQLVREAEAKAWLAGNRKAIDAFNARIEREGVWSDKLRGF